MVVQSESGHVGHEATHYCCRDNGHDSVLKYCQREINSSGTNVLYILLGGGRELAQFNRGRGDAD